MLRTNVQLLILHQYVNITMIQLTSFILTSHVNADLMAQLVIAHILLKLN